MSTIPDLEERVRSVLQAKYARDQRWDFLGPLVVRGLLLPGCTACRASEDYGSRRLSFLLHEHVNDPDAVVQLIESNGFCRRHCAHARDYVESSYGDQLKIVLLYDHLVQSLLRRLREQPEGVGPAHPRRDCPICTAERHAEAEIVDWLRDGLSIGDISALYADSSGLCLGHLFQTPTRDRRLDSPARGLLDVARSWLRRGRLVPGMVGERVALLWGGGWPGDQLDADHTVCPVCQEVVTAEGRALHSVAEGAPVDAVPCRHHTRALRRILAGREWPHAITAMMIERINARLESAGRERPRAWKGLRALRGREEQATTHGASRSECTVCRAVSAATSTALSRVTASDVGEHGCLGHIAALGRSHPDWERTLNVALASRLAFLETTVRNACRFDQVPREARRDELAILADRLTDLFVPPGDHSVDRLN